MGESLTWRVSNAAKEKAARVTLDFAFALAGIQAQTCASHVIIPLNT